MGIVSAIPEKCKRCYACVRECPAKAIKVENGQALVIEERCIACGNCVKVCTQNAKRIQDSKPHVNLILAESVRKIACLAPSFPAAFPKTASGKVISGLRRLGFDEVWDVAFGAELVARRYAVLFEESRRSGKPVIATPCPAVVAYVEKYMPELRQALAPIVSPMIAVARAIRYRYGNDVHVVFVGPCIAKKNEILDPYIVGSVDSVLTFKELDDLLKAKDIVLETLDETDFDGPRSNMGGAFPLSGGLLKTAGLRADVLDSEVAIAEGKESALAALEELEEGASHTRFLDILFCQGCISGPRMLADLGAYARKEIIARYVNERRRQVSPEEFARSLDEFRDVHLGRAFTRQDIKLSQPTRQQIEEVLQQMRKYAPEDQLDCGACGYPTCREKAIAACQGLAEVSMCLPYLVEELEDTCHELQESHQELATTHKRLVQTERLASMGQLSAGVAHEINNPLGTVLIYSHMLLRQMKEADANREDLEMIVNEATRCKKIVRGLLDFARQSRVAKASTSLTDVVDDVMAAMLPRAATAGVQLTAEIEDDVPVMMIDADQVKQMLVNLTRNGIEAIKTRDGAVTLRARLRKEDNYVVIEIADSGEGIPDENLARLFTPFFTTKEMGKGTGLGLAICYGIVKMHSGDITARSKVGKGTTFTVALPVGREEVEAGAQLAAETPQA